MGREGWAATLQVAAAQYHPGRRGVYRWQRSVAAPSHFVQSLVPCIEDRGSGGCQSIGRATCAGADCDALSVMRMLPQRWTSYQSQCFLGFKTAAPAARCLRQVSCTSRWQPIPAVHCRYIVCRAAAKHEDIERPHQDSQSRTYDETVSKRLKEASGEKETFAHPRALCMRLLHAQWLHLSVLTKLSGYLSSAQEDVKMVSGFCRSFLGACAVPQLGMGQMQAHPGQHMEWWRRSCCKLQQSISTSAWAAQRGWTGASIYYRNLSCGVNIIESSPL